MTEAEWLCCDDPGFMLDSIEGRASDRQFYLFAVACCKRLWHLFTDDRSRDAIETTALYADGFATVEMRKSAVEQASKAEADEIIGKDEGQPTPAVVAWEVARQPAFDSAYCCGYLQMLGDKDRRGDRTDWWDTHQREGEEEAKFQVPLLHDIIGNPFQPVTFDHVWLTPFVVTLAQTIYDDQTFDRMPELADALVATGCTHAEVLQHCRGTGPHVRGCWVVDLILGKD
jgi:hypothetical protein